jgi:hypothetical protein
MDFACKAAKCGLNVGLRESWVQSKSYYGRLQFNPKILANSPG